MFRYFTHFLLVAAPGVDSASGRNEYQEYFPGAKGGHCVGLTTLPLSRADCLEMWEPQHPVNLRTCNRPAQGFRAGIAHSVDMEAPGIESWWGRDFPHPSRPAMGPIQPSVQWVSGLSRG